MKNMKKVLATGALAAVMALGVAAPAMTASAANIDDFTIGTILKPGDLDDIGETTKYAIYCGTHKVVCFVEPEDSFTTILNWADEETGNHSGCSITGSPIGTFSTLLQEADYMVIGEDGVVPTPAPEFSIVNVVKTVVASVAAAFAAVLTALYWIGKIWG